MKEIASYALEDKAPKRLALAHPGDLGRLEVRLDGRRIGGFGSIAELREGRSFPLDDGSSITVALRRRYVSLFPGLDVRRDGRAVPGSAFDPDRGLRWATFQVVAIGLLNIAAGLYGWTHPTDTLADGVFGRLLSGGAFLALAMLGRLHHPVAMAAFLVAAVLFGWDTVAFAVGHRHGGEPVFSGAFFVRAAITLSIARGTLIARERAMQPKPSATG